MKKVVVAVLSVLTSLGLVGLFPSAAQAAPAAPLYFALGDSYAAGLGNTTAAGLTSYADLLVTRGYVQYGAKLAEPYGGTTDSVIADQVPQVNRSAKLVTLTVGGNDVGWVNVVAACVAGDPTSAACQTAVAQSQTAIAGLKPKVEATIRAIKRQTPSARIVVTGYPLLFPTTNPLTPLNVGLNRAMAAAAMAQDVTFVDVVPAFMGHDVLSADRWLNNPWLGDTDMPLHPNAAGQQAYLTAVAAALPGNFQQAAKAKKAA